MNFREYLLEESKKHFNITNEDENIMELKKIEGYTPFPYIHNEKTMENYIIYDMPSSFQVNILNFKNESTTSITYDSQFDLYYSEKTKNEPIIEYPYKQNFYQLTYVVNGTLNIIVEDKYQCLNKSTFIITNRNTKLRIDRNTEFTLLNICFKPEFIQELTLLFTKHTNVKEELQDFFVQNKSQQVNYMIFQPINQQNDIVDSILISLFNEMKNKDIGYLEICKHYLQRLLFNIQKPSEYLCLHTSFIKSQERTLFEETLKYIIDTKRKVSREEIGEALNYNGNYISRVFLKHAGITLAKYVRDICLSHSAHLLLNTDMPIKEIVSKIGYENKTVFYRNFKEKYGVNPGEYRMNQTL